MNRLVENSLQVRDAATMYEMPFVEGMPLQHPERVILKFGKGFNAMDLGALCYMRRSFEVREMGQSCRVDLASIHPRRVEHVRTVIQTVLKEVARKSHSLTTIYRKYQDYITFMDWCDHCGRHDVMDSQEALRQALRDYVSSLRERIQTHKLSPNTGAAYQNNVLDALRQVTGFEDLGIGINLIRRDKRIAEPTFAPDEAATGKVLAWCEALLNGFADLLVNHRPYPFALSIPAYLEIPENRLWVFPSNPWAVTGRRQGVRSSLHIDFVGGRVRMPEEVFPHTKLRQSTVRQHNNDLRAQLAQANTDPLHYSRVERAMLAMKGYFLLMLASSGQSLSVVTTLPWSAELDEQVRERNATRQQFRNIKYRANGAEVTFELGANHARLFQQYLKMRTFLLQGRSCDRLFFTFGQNNQAQSPEPVDGMNILRGFYTTLRNLDPDLPKVLSRGFRAAKQDFLIRTTDVATAAVAMQHSTGTARSHYDNGSPTTAKLEVSNFWHALEKMANILPEGTDLPGGEDRSTGTCGAPLQPKPIIEHPPVTPDCKHPEGCFFCENYHAHADETDAHKLVSARLCIRRRASLVGTNEEYERSYVPVLNRIDFILDGIKQLNPEVVVAVERRVEEDGDLTPYWSAKMRTYLELERLQ